MTMRIAVVALASFAAVAQERPSEQLSAEKWFVGTWSCKGTERQSGHAIADTTTFSMELGGSWLQERITAGGRTLVEGFAGWDGVQHVRYDFLIGGMARLTSKGFNGDTIVFEGERMVGRQKQAMKHTITKKGENAFQSAFEIEGKTAFEETCTRRQD